MPKTDLPSPIPPGGKKRQAKPAKHPELALICTSGYSPETRDTDFIPREGYNYLRNAYQGSRGLSAMGLLRMNVLIVDHNATNLKLLRVQLEAEGHKVLPCCDGVEALAALKREQVDAIISDILMPRMDGYRLCRRLRKERKHGSIPFIVYTSTFTSPGDEKMAIDVGADLLIRKPAPASEITNALAEAMQNVPRRKPRTKTAPEELGLMKEYNTRLVSKLEKKNVDLEAQRESLRKSEQQLLLQATALQNAANAITITDRCGNILWVNPAFTVLTGYVPEEVVGKNPRFLKSGRHGSEFYRKLWQTILSGQSWRGEFTNLRKDGNLFYVEQTITPVCSKPGKITQFVGIMNDVTERKRVENEAMRSREQLRALAARLQAAREEERIRISRKIHDQLGEMLTAFKLGLGWMKEVLESDGRSAGEKELLEKIADLGLLADSTADRARKLCTELRPAVLDDLGLVPAIEWQAREFQGRTNIRCETRMKVEHVVANPDQATAIFRIFQELLTNVARHARASRVRVSFKHIAPNLILQVIDNGRGIEAKHINAPASLGLLGIRERAGLLGGSVEIRGKPGKGTTVSVAVPLAQSTNHFNQRSM